VDVPCGVGMDVAKAPWERALRPASARGAVPHEARGLVPLVARRPALPPPLMVREAPGGLERAATAAGAAAGRPGVVVHPRHARDGARAPGPWATTEA
jgi:transposase